MIKCNLSGAGLGFRRELLPELKVRPSLPVDFFEIAPENWICMGGRFSRDLRFFSERFPFVCHGLSLSLGSVCPLDVTLLKKIKKFMKQHDIQIYTEHLSWCADDGHLYDLLPIPCTERSVHWIANRIQQAQDILEMPIGIENVSYYLTPPGTEMNEEAFISAIIEESGCFLHLDVNNVYVNSKNFSFDPVHYIESLPLHKVGYIHVAGHFNDNTGILIDTHGAQVIDPVWNLLSVVYEKTGIVTTCLERDFNFPSLNELLHEVETIRMLQKDQQRKISHD